MIKIIHIGDIHLGMTKYNLDRSKEEDYVLKNIIEKVKEIKPDIIIINGDITDHPISPGDLLLKRIISFFVDLKLHCDKLIINHGNHDWNGLGAVKALQSAMEIYYITEPTQILYKDIIFDVVPYIDIRKQFKNSDKPFEEANKYFMELLYNFNISAEESGKKRVFVNHGTIFGTIEVDENFDREIQIKSGVLKEFYDLAIMSHIHSRTCIDDFIYYAGTPLTCTFGEKDNDTGFLIHTLDNNKFKTEVVYTPAIQFESLEFFEETFDEIKNKISEFIFNYPNKYLKIIINCIVPIYAKNEIKNLSKNILVIQLKKQENDIIKINKIDALEKNNFPKLLENYLSKQKGDYSKILEKFKKTLEEI